MVTCRKLFYINTFNMYSLCCHMGQVFTIIPGVIHGICFQILPQILAVFVPYNVYPSIAFEGL